MNYDGWPAKLYEFDLIFKFQLQIAIAFEFSDILWIWI